MRRPIPLLVCTALYATAQQTPQSTDPHAGERAAYDDIYSSKDGWFNGEPNVFLVRTIASRKPGRALDVAMGQGRNALWLASHGWTVSGFDISSVGIAEAQKEAARRSLHLETFVTPYEDFDWGKEKWDLIVFSYFFPQAALPKVWDSLAPGGLVLVEGFHSDTSRIRPLGGGYRNNELLQVLKDYRILIYEDVQDRQDWGLPYGATNRLVRVLAQKPLPAPQGCEWEGKAYDSGKPICFGVTRWTCAADGWQRAGKCESAGRLF
jgi:SAM-dependent methyltransferase